MNFQKLLKNVRQKAEADEDFLAVMLFGSNTSKSKLILLRFREMLPTNLIHSKVLPQPTSSRKKNRKM